MTVFWKPCHDCKQRGEVPPQDKAAVNPAQMTGEIVDRTTSVCRRCHGTGMRWKNTAGK